jgi:ParB-like chromosome segregation protein Spo0J
MFAQTYFAANVGRENITMQIRDRIKELRRVRASELIPNPKNWRTHPSAQQDALRGVLADVGYADALIARETPEGLMLVDGHLRAETTPDSDVPVLVLDINEAEADLMLATLDPLAAMAGRDEERLTDLLAAVSSENDTVDALLKTLADGYESLKPELTEYPELPDGDKSDIGQITFTVTEAQRENIIAALAMAKREGIFDNTNNENGNGNALGRICEAYCNR